MNEDYAGTVWACRHRRVGTDLIALVAGLARGLDRVMRRPYPSKVADDARRRSRGPVRRCTAGGKPDLPE